MIETLWAAIQARNVAKVEQSLDLKEVNTRRQYRTPLQEACMIPQNDDVVRYLLSAKADVNMRCSSRNGLTPLLYAVWFNVGVGIVRQLLDAGADLFVVDEYYLSPVLHWLCDRPTTGDNATASRCVMARFLMDQGAMPLLATSHRTAYQYAVGSNSELIAFYQAQEVLYRQQLVPYLLPHLQHVRVMADLVVDYLFWRIPDQGKEDSELDEQVRGARIVK